MNKITIDLDPLIEFLPKNHHMIEKIKQCEVDKPGEKYEKILKMARHNPVINSCLEMHKDKDISYSEFLEMSLVYIAAQHEMATKELIKFHSTKSRPRIIP